jgi:hypothetical protein
MTKEQFILGTPFRVKGIHTNFGDSTYYYQGRAISKQIRSSLNEKVISDIYHLNVTEVGEDQFNGFVFVLDKKVEVEYKFEDLVEFKTEEELV